MARSFSLVSTEYLLGSFPSTLYPLVFAGWGYPLNITLGMTMFSLGNSGSTDRYFRVIFGGNSGGDPILVNARGDTASVFAQAGTYSANTWQHVCGMWLSETSRRAYLDGGNEDTNASDSGSVTAPNQAAIGAIADQTPGGFLDGNVAECAVWDLTNWPGATVEDKADNFRDTVLQSLAAGFSPLLFPLGLISYWPLGGIYGVNKTNEANGDLDIVGGFHLDPNNTPSFTDHPAIIYPNSGLVIPVSAGAPPAVGFARSKVFGSLAHGRTSLVG